MDELSDSDEDDEGTVPTESNSKADTSRHASTSTDTSHNSTQAEASVPHEASDDRHCVDTDSKITKTATRELETDTESQAVTERSDQRERRGAEDIQEKDGLSELVSKGAEDHQATEEQSTEKVRIKFTTLNNLKAVSDCLHLMTAKFAINNNTAIKKLLNNKLLLNS